MQAKNKNNFAFRSQCPISSALDIVGDKWSLLIIRDLAFKGKSSFKDFAESEEKMATNILSDRLKKLEGFGVITKSKLPENKKANVYGLTQKGVDLIPALVEIILWSDKHLHDHIAQEAKTFAIHMKEGKEEKVKGMISAFK